MTCEFALSLIEPYLDGELDASQKAEVARHIAGCEACAAAELRLSDLRSDLRNLRPVDGATDRLRARVMNRLRQEAAVVPIVKTPRWRSVEMWAVAATVLLGVSLVRNVMQTRSSGQTGRDAEVAQEIVSSHVRSLIGNHLLDVPSTDQHNVKPWFNGKLDYAPDVKDFAADGFPLIGGRVDYLDHRPVAALVFRRREHVINLFVWPAGSLSVTSGASNGFNVVAWNRDGMSYRAVSDLNSGELRQFVGLYQK